MNFEETGRGVEESEAGVVMLQNGLECRNNPFEESRDIPRADEKIVDFEKNLEAIAFARELLLGGLCGFGVDGVIHGHGDLGADALHEFDFDFGHTLGNIAAEAHGAEAMLRGSQRNDGDGVNAGFLDALHEIGIAGVLRSIE